MAPRGYAWQTAPAAAAMVLALGLTGCGGRSNSTAVGASVRPLVTRVARHGVAVCCAGPRTSRSAWTTYWIPSESMEPTVKVGQRVTAQNAAIRSHPPSLGDILVFHPPAGADPVAPACGSPTEGQGQPRPCGAPTQAQSGQTFIKRVVGLPGDRIAIVSGHVIRNGVRERDPYTFPCLSIDRAECTFPEAIVIPPGEYYMLGDNRGASDDSRFWGPVKRSWIIGFVTR